MTVNLLFIYVEILYFMNVQSIHFIRDIVSKCVSNGEASMTQYEVLIVQTITRLKLEERLAKKPSNFIN